MRPKLSACRIRPRTQCARRKTRRAVLVERRKEAKTGDIVIAEVDGDWTMKVFRKRGRRVSLEPANPHYPTIIPKKHLRIAAVVIAVIRQYPT